MEYVKSSIALCKCGLIVDQCGYKSERHNNFSWKSSISDPDKICGKAYGSYVEDRA
jgi:hypothetical protein